MKNKLFTVASIVLVWLGFYINILTGDFSALHFLASLIYLAFWILLFVKCHSGKAMMRYAAILWGICAFTAFFNLFYTNEVFLLLFMLLFSPMFGIQFLIPDAIACVSVMGVISVVLMVAALVFLRRLKKKPSESI